MEQSLLNARLRKKLEQFSIHARRAFLGAKQGGHNSPRKGHGIEFADYRKYELGDNPRYIDWSLYARTEKLYVKQYKEEEDLTVALLLDGSPSMHSVTDDLKWKRATTLAASLGYVSLMNHDVVSLSLLGTGYKGVFNNPHRIGQLIAKLKTPAQSEQRNFSREIGRIIAQLRFPGVVCFISDFLFPLPELQSILLQMRARNFAVTLMQVLGDSDHQPLSVGESAKAHDSEKEYDLELFWSQDIQEEYKKVLSQHCHGVARAAKNNGMKYILIDPKKDIEAIILSELPTLGILKA